MSEPAITLHGMELSGHVHRVVLLLRMLGLPYRFVAAPPEVRRTPEFLKLRIQHLLTEFCSQFFEQGCDILPPLRKGQIKCRLLVIGSRMQIRAVGNEKLRDVPVTGPSGRMKSGPAAMLRGIRICAVLQQ